MLWQDYCLFQGMKKIQSALRFILVTTFIFLTQNLVAQDYSQIDQIVSKYPKNYSKLEDLANKINKDFIEEEEKARAIFYWIATNVKYDVKAYFSQRSDRPVAYSFKSQEEKLAKQRQFKLDLALNTLKSKKAVCQGYTALFDHLAELANLESVTVTGTSKTNPAQIGKLPGASDHAWNAIKINGEWKLVEPTWASGVVDPAKQIFIPKFNDGYFLTPPHIFAFTHFPDDKKWLLGNLTEQQFAASPLYYGEYVQASYTFLSPNTGIFDLKKFNVVPFKIENLKSEDQVTYVFSRFKKVELPVLKRDGKNTEFEIQIPSNATGFLTLYINNKGIAVYKIQR